VDARARDAAGDGSSARPWTSIQQAAERMQPGELCVIHAGTYRETVRPRDGQTFTAAPGEAVVLTGCDAVTAWQPAAEGSRVWTASVPPTVREVFVDGRRMNLARFPDEDGDLLDAEEWLDTRLEHLSDQTAKVTFKNGRSWPKDFWKGG
jgi:hypothetical protein